VLAHAVPTYQALQVARLAARGQASHDRPLKASRALTPVAAWLAALALGAPSPCSGCGRPRTRARAERLLA
jgi:hypothetical protein